MIVGRDALVERAIGTKSFGGTTYRTTAKYLAGLLAPGNVGYAALSLQFTIDLLTLFHGTSVNHSKHALPVAQNAEVDIDCLTLLDITTDGITALLRIIIIQ